MNNTTLQTWILALQAIGAVVAILAGILTVIVQIRKLGSHWRATALGWFLVLGPLISYALGVAALNILKSPVAAILFACAFTFQIIGFLRARESLNRSAVVYFGLECCFFVIMFLASFISPIVDILQEQLVIMAKMVGVLEHMSH